MSDAEPREEMAGAREWAGALFAVALVALGVADRMLAAGKAAGEAGTVPSTRLSEATDGTDPERVQFAYGFTPVDVSLLADAARDLEGPAIAAGYPGRRVAYDDLPEGPVLTRTSDAGAKLSDGDDSRSTLRALEGPWQQLVYSSVADEPGRRPNLAAAQVSVRDGDEEYPCPRYGLHRYRCDRPKWAEYRWRQLEIGGSKRHCIWAHPLSDRTVVFDFGVVDPATSGGYTLRTALRDSIAGGGPDVDVRVRRGDESVEHVHDDTSNGWQQTRLPSLDRPAPLRIEVSAEDTGQRHFCFVVRDQ